MPIWILGVPKKCAITVPKLLTELPMIAKVNAPAVMPKLADPEAIPVIPIAAAIKPVIALTYGKTNKPKLPPITITMIGSNKIV